MVVAIFRSRIRAEGAQKYYALADEMETLARAMPGFIAFKAYTSSDGERVSVHEWESAEHLAAWRNHPQHVRAQAKGRESYYEEYSLFVCDQPKTTHFQRPAGEAQA